MVDKSADAIAEFTVVAEEEPAGIVNAEVAIRQKARMDRVKNFMSVWDGKSVVRAVFSR